MKALIQKSPNSRYVTVTVDDFIPVDAETNEPVFTCPNGNEMWVMIIVKDFAKYMGSYGAIEGGYPLYAVCHAHHHRRRCVQVYSRCTELLEKSRD